MRLVLDTNVLIAAFVARGVCHELVEHCEREHEMITSELLLREFEETLAQKFRLPSAKAAEAVALFQSHSQVVTPEPLAEPICRDPDDDWVLATASTGQCRCIITGDKDLLSLVSYQDIYLLAPRAFWSFEASSPGSA